VAQEIARRGSLLNDKDYKPKQLLTKREKEVFELLVQDRTTKEIAEELFISEKTVRNHISNAMHTICKLIQISKKATKELSSSVAFLLELYQIFRIRTI
jgi:LuxR family transcriptional regulator, transcriptional regulator of spore coat protein